MEEDTDCPVWRWSKCGSFMISSTYRHFVDEGYRLSLAKAIWNARYALKVRIFLWLTVKDPILTWNNFQKRGCSGPNVYILCGSSEESIPHIIQQYRFAIFVWAMCAQHVGMTVSSHPVHNIWNNSLHQGEEESTRYSGSRSVLEYLKRKK